MPNNRDCVNFSKNWGFSCPSNTLGEYLSYLGNNYHIDHIDYSMRIIFSIYISYSFENLALVINIKI